MARFWKLTDETGDPVYVDPYEIVQVFIDEDKFTAYTVRGGAQNYYKLDKASGERVLAWAESESEEIPEIGGRPLFGVA
jgi:hypothetical protein